MKISNFLSRKQNSNDQAGGLSIPCKECGKKFTEQESLKKHKKIPQSGRGERKKPSSP
jgi:uncharacterized Zn-finger protein